ncbi:MAG: GldG family protein [Methylicorpusculum sp.]|uniref:GldG family protein n=2 Tax=Methylicorpusculum sp. TaxID=2713644 RepID=UPI002725DCFA|nr:GldG family protein [Methylicorpusculum sp.]MDO8844873.1 GldG family protein [Methylicorpusculum sp.]MDO8938346.1 GldG family protein [Methylicorpusculum sp.]MDP2200391.1 GldG family protein [Methylicorpusculum sp.]
MKLSRSIHRKLRIKNSLITCLLISLLAGLAWFSTQFNAQWDITVNAVNTLSPATQNVLNSLHSPVKISAYIKRDPSLRAQIAQLVARYTDYKPDLTLSFIDPDSNPNQARELNIASTGTLFVDYQDRRERINYLDESTLTNALTQLAYGNDRWISVLTGHGERAIDGRANFDWGQFGQELTKRNIKAQTLNLAEMPAIPDNAQLLILASPTVKLLPGEINIIKQFLDQGGHFLWLYDPDSAGQPELESYLGITRLPGTVMDTQALLYGVNDASFVLIGRYPPHPLTQNFQLMTLFPQSAALESQNSTVFDTQAWLQSSEKSWTETGSLSADAVFNAGDLEKLGPLAIAYALKREIEGRKEQRILVMGDGDFIANAFIGNVGNADLGLRIINWLTGDDRMVAIPIKKAPDKELLLPPVAVAVMGFGFLLIIPAVLIISGLLIWRKRKRR